ncbi:MAG: hypothetical protein HFH59_09280 [Lachnospiraceae bacterium]|nr:hypothetical protein [Lachnospiraceae bacterium]
MYTVTKPLNLRGRRRVIGEIVGEHDVEQSRAAFFIRNGYLSEINEKRPDTAGSSASVSVEKQKPESKVDIPIIKKDGAMALSTAPESVSMALWLIQTAAAEAVPEIGRVEDEDILIILDACDTRKTVKEAARIRAAELHGKNAANKGGG